MADASTPLDPDAVSPLDLCGLQCPLPVLKTRKALDRLPIGARLLVTATDPMAAIDIPHFCSQAGHGLLEQERDGSVLRFLIERR